MKICWAQVAMLIVVAGLALSSALLTGCGQKGPLYHPTETSQNS